MKISKLQSNRGASMLLALAVFLICTVVSSVIIAAAASGASRHGSRDNQQRAYLAINSATDLLVEEMKNMGSYVGICEDRHYGCEECTIKATIEFFYQDISGYRLDMSLIPNALDEAHLIVIDTEHEDSGKSWKIDKDHTKLSGILGDLTQRAAFAVQKNGGSYEENFEIRLQDSGKAEDSRMPRVNCHYHMSENYGITLTVTAEESAYSIIIRSRANVEYPEPVVDDTFGCAHTVYYKEYTEIGSFEDRKVDNWNIAGKKTSYITNVSWGTPQIEKGVAVQ